MPPEIRTDRNTMLDGVMAIIEESGYAAVSARSIAERLGISTQPIYREFGDMDGVRHAAAERGWAVLAEHLKCEVTEQAVNYVLFACERKNLFNFLFRDRNCQYDGLDDMSHKILSDTIIDGLQSITGLPREQVYRLHLSVWMALHGLAAISADNEVTLSRDEIRQFTVELTRAVSMFYKSQKDGDA